MRMKTTACTRTPAVARTRHDGRHATKVRGLEAYGIDPAAFGKQVQKRFACSTAAQPAPVGLFIYLFFIFSSCLLSAVFVLQSTAAHSRQER